MDGNGAPQGWFQYALGAIVGLLGLIFEGYRQRFSKVESNYVTKDQLERYITDATNERLRMHSENLENFRQIREWLMRDDYR